MLVAARLVQGAGAGGLTTLSFVVISDRVPMYRRASYSAYISTIYAVASVFGPIAGPNVDNIGCRGRTAQHLRIGTVLPAIARPRRLREKGLITLVRPAAFAGERSCVRLRQWLSAQE
ncbi:MFS transporter [Devosia sp.]|uniref:MFS transporter n=1 Tax=Devosia sp. TaxID=1871048 RepID=UPI00345BABFF